MEVTFMSITFMSYIVIFDYIYNRNFSFIESEQRRKALVRPIHLRYAKSVVACQRFLRFCCYYFYTQKLSNNLLFFIFELSGNRRKNTQFVQLNFGISNTDISSTMNMLK